MRLLARSHITVACERDCPVVAMLRPRSGAAQWVISERYELTPWVPATEYVDSFGNLCQRYTVPPGRSTIAVESEVEVDDHLAVDMDAPRTPIEEVPDDALVYLLQSRYCPSDKMEQHGREVVQDTSPGYAQVERIRQWIHDNHEYRYGVSQESTDALDTMQARAGVCRDFAHIGVALCRSLKIPARVVVGSRPTSAVAGTPSTPPRASRAAAASWSPTAATSPTSPSCPTTGRWRFRR
jgi:transglutaminase-like putative cysteine protease